MGIEGIGFRETPEQARRSASRRVDEKLRSMEMLTDADYDVLRERETESIEELRRKLGVI